MRFPPFLQTNEATRPLANAQSLHDTEQLPSDALDFIGTDRMSQVSPSSQTEVAWAMSDSSLGE
jgi:hypothetical protein